MLTHEIVKRGKLFTDGEYIQECLISISKVLFNDLKYKYEFI